jgi:hypothetical protein
VTMRIDESAAAAAVTSTSADAIGANVESAERTTPLSDTLPERCTIARSSVRGTH